MPFLDTAALDSINKRPGWNGKLFHSENNTFVWWDFAADADIHNHRHSQEEVWLLIEGELEVTIGGEKTLVRPGMAAIIPPDTAHSVRVIQPGHAIVVDHPLRERF